jgi:putative ABC transport system permease protein
LGASRRHLQRRLHRRRPRDPARESAGDVITPAGLFRIAWEALRRNAMRSLLTTLGIIIGVAAVITAMAIGAGARAAVTAQLARLGSNLVIVVPASSAVGGAQVGEGIQPTLTLEDAQAIATQVPLVSGVAPQSQLTEQAIGGGTNWRTTILGTTTDWLQVQNWTMNSGRFFNDQEQRNAAKVAVVGKTVAQNLFGTANPVGQTVIIKSVPFTIVGVLESKGQSGFGRDQDDQIVVPITSQRYRLTGSRWVNSIVISAQSADSVDPVIKSASGLLRLRHHLTASQNNDFSIRNIANIQAAFNETSRIQSLLLAGVAAISLLVGGIGIMNIMLVSVTERVREIGIRMAVGAKSRDILAQFLIEAVTLACIGGAIGIALGTTASVLTSKFAGWQTLVSPESVALSFGFSALVGVAFGFYPARQAAQLRPIEALRHE